MSTENTSFRSKLLPALALGAIILLGAFLRFYNLGAASIGNEYYAAAVKSMLTSWHNFFFVSFEPGGSVSVDKPPLGFWLEAVSAYFLGVNGFALAFPNALAGTLAIPLLYSLVRKQFGRLAGLTSALVLATIPVTIATERNNTIDGMLVFVLLLAAWAVWKAVESGRFRYLLFGVLLIGLGFNIKMLQAYMVLPALYALYFFGAKQGRLKRLVHLGLATGLLLVVSLSWALIVDSVPAESRPFIGSSTDNTVMELILGHNGIRRLIGGGGPGNNPADGQATNNPQADDGGKGQGPALGLAPLPQNDDQRPRLNGQPGQPQGPSNGDGQRPLMGGQPGQPPQPPDGFNQNNRPGGPSEVGTAGLTRLLTQPLASQASWLLPLALLGLVLTLVVLGRPWPLTEKHLALILWAGWLLPMLVYFTFTTGLWHTYYLTMLGPGLAALVGATVWALSNVMGLQTRIEGRVADAFSAYRDPDGGLWRGRDEIASGRGFDTGEKSTRPTQPPALAPTSKLGWILTAVLSGITLGFEIFVLTAYPAYLVSTTAVMVVLWLMGLGLLWARPRSWALALVILSLLVGPLFWSGLTTFSGADVNLPKAGPGMNNQPVKVSSTYTLSPVQQKLLDTLLANTPSEGYLVAAVDSHSAAPFILATGRPVLTIGGFNGRDKAVSLSRVQELIASGELRFVLDNGNLQDQPEIFQWVSSSCQVVKIPGLPVAAQASNNQPDGGPRNQQFNALYDCGGK